METFVAIAAVVVFLGAVAYLVKRNKSGSSDEIHRPGRPSHDDK